MIINPWIVVIVTIIGCVVILILPGLITGDWYADRIKNILERKDGWR